MTKLCRRLGTIVGVACVLPLCAEDKPAAPKQPANVQVYAPPMLLQLNVDKAVEMALANNLDIAIQRFQPQIAAEAIEFQRGAYDPFLSLSIEKEISDRPNLFADRVFPIVHSDQTRFSGSLTGNTPIGLEYSFTATMTRIFQAGDKNPDYLGFAGIEVRQHLLRDFGVLPNNAQLYIAQKDKLRSEQDFASIVMTIVADTKKAFYELQFAIHQVEIQEKALLLAQSLLSDNRKKLAAGVLSHLDVVQAESAVAKAESDLLLAHQIRHTQENQFKALITRDIYGWRQTRIEPLNGNEAAPILLDTEESMRQGLANRPEYLSAKYLVEREKINVQFQWNQGLPTLDLIASYGANSDNVGLSRSIEDIIHGDTPTKSVSVEFSTPIPNRQGEANYRTARLNVASALEQFKKAEQVVLIEVDNSLRTVESNYKRVQATDNARRYAEEALRAEQTKFDAGTSTNFLVLQAQQNLTQARGEHYRAIADYNKSITDLYRSEGTILTRHNITLQPAKAKAGLLKK